eukprot:CAMPEP_0197395784 /NCGR_PEP_ID=MMETSP1165-20131217/7267_1 /TAXON_ID=284809 /ORGANISM="Chrysocystis fragilis, Strain CCMP3189" /LENGTH=167 /DNA_ID=CAMNT_0042921561 /DNA_START=167 /DNA_END=671 /DNA_ORIENTATION=-
MLVVVFGPVERAGVLDRGVAAPSLPLRDHRGLDFLGYRSLLGVVCEDGRPVLSRRDARRVLGEELGEDRLVRDRVVELDHQSLRVIAQTLVRWICRLAARVADESRPTPGNGSNDACGPQNQPIASVATLAFFAGTTTGHTGAWRHHAAWRTIPAAATRRAICLRAT